MKSSGSRRLGVTAAFCALCCLPGLAPGDDKPPAPKTAPKPKATAKPKREPVMTPGGQWRRSDMNRPRPRVVDPGPAPPPSPVPSDAVVLFDGKDLSAWEGRLKTQSEPVPAAWKVADGYFEVVPRSGSLVTR